MKIMITGADSFVGSYIIPQLIVNEYPLLLIGQDVERLEKIYPQASIISYININQDYLVRRVSAFSPDIVIHLAVYSTPNDEYTDMVKLFNANLLFLGKVLDALKQTRPKLFINTGSSTEYYKANFVYDPAYLYSATKTAARYIIKYYSSAYKYNYCTVNPYSLYGGVDTRKKIMDVFRESLDSKTEIETTYGEQILDFIHIDDLVNLYLLIIENYKNIENGTTYEGGTGIGHSLKDVVRYMEKQTGKKANLNWGGRNYRNRDVMFSVADISKQNKQFGWLPKVSLEEGIKRYLNANKINNKE